MYIQGFFLFQSVVVCWLMLPSVVVAFGEARSGCQAKCGDISIPYPFGVTAGGKDDYLGGAEGCSVHGVGYGYNVNCVTSPDGPPKPFMGIGNLEILGISETEIRIKEEPSTLCYSMSGDVVRNQSISWDLSVTPFMFSNTKNKFFVVGCNSAGYFRGFDQFQKGYESPCLTLCNSREEVKEGYCNVNGCCQSNIPKGIKKSSTGVARASNTTYLSFSPCSYAFLAEYEQFTFYAPDLLPESKVRDKIPVVLDWAIGNKTCEEAQQNATTYACQENSHCSNSENNPGYRCTCIDGYKGNAYLSPGCLDVNECEDQSNNPCEGICINTKGSYNCTCPIGSSGDGRKDGKGCTSNVNRNRFPILAVTLGAGLGLLFLIIATSWVHFIIKRRKLLKQKEKFFQQNGGYLLKQQISSNEGVVSSKIFTTEELSLATDNYNESLILGTGGFGTVYKGTIPDGRVVAIKKSKIVDQSQIEQFINEVFILTQINHRNVVKLLGCCLETEVPLLVYEYVSNGTLSEHLHTVSGVPSVSWESRLRIAVETAGALAYLHSAVATPIIHRDIKTANILLDENYTAKVADFGASRLIPLEQTEISTVIMGTRGYLDPEYRQTGLLTEKSDVYSFGVVLLELLTAKKPIFHLRSGEPRNLALYFISLMEEDNLLQILDARVVSEGTQDQVIGVAEVAKKCLKMTGEERPTMRLVTTELESLRGTKTGAWSRRPNHETRTALSTEPRDLYTVPIISSSTSTDSGGYSLNEHL